MARLVLPSRLELKRPAGSASNAPFAKVSFNILVRLAGADDSAVGPDGDPVAPFHFLDRLGVGLLMRARTRASVSARQSPGSEDSRIDPLSGRVCSCSFLRAALLFFMVVVGFFMVACLREGGGVSDARRPRTSPLAKLVNLRRHQRIVVRPVSISRALPVAPTGYSNDRLFSLAPCAYGFMQSSIASFVSELGHTQPDTRGWRLRRRASIRSTPRLVIPETPRKFRSRRAVRGRISRDEDELTSLHSRPWL